MKKILLTTLLALVIGVTTLASGADAVNADTYGSIEYEVVKDAPMTRWIGRGNAKATNFLANCGKYDRVLYLSDTLLLKTVKAKSAVSSNKKVIKVENDRLVPMSQGKATVTFKLNDGTKKKEVIAVTTYNDGKNVATATSVDIDTENFWYYYNMKSAPENLQRICHTIQDAAYIIELLDVQYSADREPAVGRFMWGDCWMTSASASTTIESGYGVCLQAAELGAYLLADDFEDWGFIHTKGEVGHIFNWFYEDGKYYIFDFTQIISSHVSPPNVRNITFRGVDYWKNQIYCTSKITKNTPGVKENISDITWLVMMYSALGHDYMPAWWDGGCHMSVEDVYKSGKITWGNQKEVMDSATKLYQTKKLKVKLISPTYKELPEDLKLSNMGTYGYHTEIVTK